MQGKDQHVHPSFPVDINENKFSFFFLDYYFLRGHVLNFT